eukprot:TRINITY_DN3393_c0_g1_i1.p1 TRINITY_DN3393_c0_g1~~TRINITY_DN3393_c0_g1_i1.p1  ORF type:complete len:149 (-),score=34.99 TRINITY_DN3393_c0_g1_i1:303-749(-)
MDVSGLFDDRKTIGFGLTGFGLFFMFLGVMMLFDRALLAMGNVLFLAGTTTIIGTEQTYNFFFRRDRLRGTACFFLGIVVVVVVGWPVTGMLIESFGFINLFGNFFPVALKFAQSLPVVGNMFMLLEKIPSVAVIMERLKMKQDQFPV